MQLTNTGVSPLERNSERLMNFTCKALVVTVWSSAFLFGLYILAFYFMALFGGDMNNWNKVLPGLYDPQRATATVGIGIHFAAGGIILILGCIQLIESFRKKYPAAHRWIGRVYIAASLLAGLGGLVFIFIQGTVGGTVMNIGFSLYGILMIICATETIRHAMAKRFELHRAWAIRLFALAIGSWLYRMDYGFWFLLANGYGHTDQFNGSFDYFMDFFFYLPNLLVAEIYIGRWKILKTPQVKIAASIGLLLATAFLLLGTFFFTTHLWGPAILSLAGISS